MLETPGRQPQQRHGGSQAVEEARLDAPQHHPGQATTQQGADQLRRALHQQRLQRVNIAVDAGDDAPGAGLVEVADRQPLDMGEHLHAQGAEHADRRVACNELRSPCQQEAPQPAGGQSQAEPQHQALVEQPVAGFLEQPTVDQLADEPRPQEHGEHQQQFQADHAHDRPTDRPQQRQQAVQHAAIEGLARQALFDVDIAFSHARSPAGRGSGRCAPPVRRGGRWR